VPQIGCDFLARSAHKMCGATSFGVLYGRGERLEETPPYQGGGEMILSVDYHQSTWKDAPHRFEAGTPDISGAIGLHAAMDYLDRIGRDRIAQHGQELGAYAFEKLAALKGIRLFGPGPDHRPRVVATGTGQRTSFRVPPEAAICSRFMNAKVG
jgi:cysteine desulfurase/selenocysteine lyase